MTTSVERLESRLAAVTARLDLIDGVGGMIDTTRRVVAGTKFKIETGSSQPQIIEPTEDGGGLALGTDGSWRIVDVLNDPVSHTGDTIETTLHTAVLPADSMGANGIVRISSIWRTTVGGGGTWWNRIDFGGVNIARRNHTSQNALDSRPIYIWNTNDVNAQGHMENLLLMSSHFGNSPVTTAAIDTTADVDIDFTAQGGNAAHVITLYFALVEVSQRA